MSKFSSLVYFTTIDNRIPVNSALDNWEIEQKMCLYFIMQVMKIKLLLEVLFVSFIGVILLLFVMMYNVRIFSLQFNKQKDEFIKKFKEILTSSFYFE